MPFYDMDPEILEEYADELGDAFVGPPGETSSYQPAEAVIQFDRIAGPFRDLSDAMLAKGFTTIRGHYDGGYDEGFAYFDDAIVNGVAFRLHEVAELLGTDELAEKLTSHADEDAGPPKILAFPGVTQCENASITDDAADNGDPSIPPATIVEGVMEEFMYLVCTELLYEGFGTGEVAICGTFELDLDSGRVEDIERRPETSED